jgi:hypothetical protein
MEGVAAEQEKIRMLAKVLAFMHKAITAVLAQAHLLWVHLAAVALGRLDLRAVQAKPEEQAARALPLQSQVRR